MFLLSAKSKTYSFRLKIEARKMTKVTVPRLHFQETTMNNQRKNGRANPDQKFFLLVVRLIATSEDGQEHLVQAYHSERVIVRVRSIFISQSSLNIVTIRMAVVSLHPVGLDVSLLRMNNLEFW